MAPAQEFRVSPAGVAKRITEMANARPFPVPGNANSLKLAPLFLSAATAQGVVAVCKCADAQETSVSAWWLLRSPDRISVVKPAAPSVSGGRRQVLCQRVTLPRYGRYWDWPTTIPSEQTMKT